MYKVEAITIALEVCRTYEYVYILLVFTLFVMFSKTDFLLYNSSVVLIRELIWNLPSGSQFSKVRETARCRSWYRPVLNNEGKVSSS